MPSSVVHQFDGSEGSITAEDPLRKFTLNFQGNLPRSHPTAMLLGKAIASRSTSEDGLQGRLGGICSHLLRVRRFDCYKNDYRTSLTRPSSVPDLRNYQLIPPHFLSAEKQRAIDELCDACARSGEKEVWNRTCRVGHETVKRPNSGCTGIRWGRRHGCVFDRAASHPGKQHPQGCMDEDSWDRAPRHSGRTLFNDDFAEVSPRRSSPHRSGHHPSIPLFCRVRVRRLMVIRTLGAEESRSSSCSARQFLSTSATTPPSVLHNHRNFMVYAGSQLCLALCTLPAPTATRTHATGTRPAVAITFCF